MLLVHYCFVSDVATVTTALRVVHVVLPDFLYVTVWFRYRCGCHRSRCVTVITGYVYYRSLLLRSADVTLLYRYYRLRSFITLGCVLVTVAVLVVTTVVAFTCRSHVVVAVLRYVVYRGCYPPLRLRLRDFADFARYVLPPAHLVDLPFPHALLRCLLLLVALR